MNDENVFWKLPSPSTSFRNGLPNFYILRMQDIWETSDNRTQRTAQSLPKRHITELYKYSTSTNYAPKLDNIQFLPNPPNPNIPRLQTTERSKGHNFYHNGTLIYSPTTAKQPIKLKILDNIQSNSYLTSHYCTSKFCQNTANPTITKTLQILTYQDFTQPKAANAQSLPQQQITVLPKFSTSTNCVQNPQ